MEHVLTKLQNQVDDEFISFGSAPPNGYVTSDDPEAQRSSLLVEMSPSTPARLLDDLDEPNPSDFADFSGYQSAMLAWAARIKTALSKPTPGKPAGKNRTPSFPLPPRPMPQTESQKQFDFALQKMIDQRDSGSNNKDEQEDRKNEKDSKKQEQELVALSDLLSGLTSEIESFPALFHTSCNLSTFAKWLLMSEQKRATFVPQSLLNQRVRDEEEFVPQQSEQPQLTRSSLGSALASALTLKTAGKDSARIPGGSSNQIAFLSENSVKNPQIGETKNWQGVWNLFSKNENENENLFRMVLERVVRERTKHENCCAMEKVCELLRVAVSSSEASEFGEIINESLTTTQNPEQKTRMLLNLAIVVLSSCQNGGQKISTLTTFEALFAQDVLKNLNQAHGPSTFSLLLTTFQLISIQLFSLFVRQNQLLNHDVGEPNFSKNEGGAGGDRRSIRERGFSEFGWHLQDVGGGGGGNVEGENGLCQILESLIEDTLSSLVSQLRSNPIFLSQTLWSLLGNRSTVLSTLALDACLVLFGNAPNEPQLMAELNNEDVSLISNVWRLMRSKLSHVKKSGILLLSALLSNQTSFIPLFHTYYTTFGGIATRSLIQDIETISLVHRTLPFLTNHHKVSVGSIFGSSSIPVITCDSFLESLLFVQNQNCGNYYYYFDFISKSFFGGGSIRPQKSSLFCVFSTKNQQVRKFANPLHAAIQLQSTPESAEPENCGNSIVPHEEKETKKRILVHEHFLREYVAGGEGQLGPLISEIERCTKSGGEISQIVELTSLFLSHIVPALCSSLPSQTTPTLPFLSLSTGGSQSSTPTHSDISTLTTETIPAPAPQTPPPTMSTLAKAKKRLTLGRIVFGKTKSRNSVDQQSSTPGLIITEGTESMTSTPRRSASPSSEFSEGQQSTENGEKERQAENLMHHLILKKLDNIHASESPPSSSELSWSGFSSSRGSGLKGGTATPSSRGSLSGTPEPQHRYLSQTSTLRPPGLSFDDMSSPSSQSSSPTNTPPQTSAAGLDSPSGLKPRTSLREWDAASSSPRSSASESESGFWSTTTRQQKTVSGLFLQTLQQNSQHQRVSTLFGVPNGSGSLVTIDPKDVQALWEFVCCDTFASEQGLLTRARVLEALGHLIHRVPGTLESLISNQPLTSLLDNLLRLCRYKDTAQSNELNDQAWAFFTLLSTPPSLPLPENAAQHGTASFPFPLHLELKRAWANHLSSQTKIAQISESDEQSVTKDSENENEENLVFPYLNCFFECLWSKDCQIASNCALAFAKIFDPTSGLPSEPLSHLSQWLASKHKAAVLWMALQMAQVNQGPRFQSFAKLCRSLNSSQGCSHLLRSCSEIPGLQKTIFELSDLAEGHHAPDKFGRTRFSVYNDFSWF